MSQYQVPPVGGQPEQDGRYPAQSPDGQQPAEVTVEVAGGLGLPSEFNHLFRDSTPEDRRSIDRVPNGIGAPQAGFGQQQAPAQAKPQAQPQAPGYPQQQGGYQGAESGGYPAAQQGYAPQQGQYPQYDQEPAGFNAAATQSAYADPFAGGQQQYQGGQYPQQQPDNGFGSGPYGTPGAQGPQYPDGPGGSGAHLPFDGGSPAPGVSRKRLLIGGGVVAVVAVIALAISLSANSGSGKPSPTKSTAAAAASPSATGPKAAAAAIYALIQQSSELRSNANGGVSSINSCSNLGSAQSLLSSTAQQRSTQAASVAKIDVTGLSGGAELVSALQQAWSASAAYDSDYAKIATDLASGCTSDKVKADPNYSAANSEGDTADTQKANAAQLWNANATTSALGQIDQNSL